MAFDVKKWLTDDMGFSAEQADALAPQFADQKRVSVLETRYLDPSARAKFEADQAALAKAQADFAAANERLNTEMAEWASLSAKEKQDRQAQHDALIAAQTQAYELEQRLKAVAQQNGIDPASVLPAKPAAKPEEKPTVTPEIDEKRFLRPEQVAPLFDYNLNLPAQLQFIADEHRELTGQRLDTRAIVAEIQARAKKNDPNIDPVKVWEEKYDIPKIRESKAKEQYEADIKAAELRGRESALSERAMPGPADPGRHSPIFRNGEGQFAPRTSVLKRPAPEQGVRSAAQALATGKYRTGAQ